MELLGNANWWLPRWLVRIVPHVDVDGHEVVPQAEAAEAKEPVGAGRGS